MTDTSHTPIRVGLAGCGRSGWENHAEKLAAMPELYCLVAAADVDPARAKETAERFGYRAHQTLDALFADDDVELAVIATPNLVHAEHSIQALQAGRHVVCEKPMATSVADADRMIAAAEKTGRVLTIFQNRRYGDDFQKVREVIESGRLGRIVMIRMAFHAFKRRWDWQTIPELGGGLLNNMGPHLVDQALLLMGDVEPEVFCHLASTELSAGDAEDHCKIILQAAGAPVIDIEMSQACASSSDTWVVMGTRGGLSGSAVNLKWRWTDIDALPERAAERGAPKVRTFKTDDLVWEEESWTWPAGARKSHFPFYEDVYATVRRNAPLVVTPRHVRRVTEVIERCRQMGK